MLLLKIKLRVLYKLDLPCCTFFLSLLLFQADLLGCRDPPCSLPCQGFWDTREREPNAGHPLLFKRAPVSYGNGVSPLSRDFIGFLCNPGNISLFSLLYSLNCKTFPYLSLYLYISLTSPSTLQTPWIQWGLDPSKGPFPCFVGKRIPEFPSQLKIRRSHIETRELFQGSCHNSKIPWCTNPLQINLISLHWVDCHPKYRLKTRWQLWQPGGTSRESHRCLCQLDRKPDTIFTAREESGLPWLHMRRGLIPLLKLHRNTEIHVSTGVEAWGSVLISRWGPRIQHRLERSPESLLITRMETGLS